MDGALGRNEPTWHLRHNCPACMYRLKDEPPLKFSMLFVQDGNDSLKRFERRADPDDANPELGPSVESFDTRTEHGNLYLSRADVDKWATKTGTKDVHHDEVGAISQSI